MTSIYRVYEQAYGPCTGTFAQSYVFEPVGIMAFKDEPAPCMQVPRSATQELTPHGIVWMVDQTRAEKNNVKCAL